MSTGTATAAPPKTYAEYVRSICDSDPSAALELALAETERQRFALQKAQEELRGKNADLQAKAEVELDEHGRFVAKNLAGLMSIGEMYAKSGMVPAHYKDQPGACAIAEQMARRCNVDTLLFMQNTYPVQNKIGMEAKLVIAMLNASGKIVGRIRWTFSGTGDNRQCTAYVTDKDTGEKLEQTVPWSMVVAEGWTKNPKWKSMPDVMFQYRSAAFLARVYYPDVLMGMHTADELEDVALAEPLAPRKPMKSIDELTDRLEGKTETNGHAANGNGATKAETAQQTETAADDGKLTVPDLIRTIKEFTGTLDELKEFFKEQCKTLSDDDFGSVNDVYEQKYNALKAK